MIKVSYSSQSHQHDLANAIFNEFVLHRNGLAGNKVHSSAVYSEMGILDLKTALKSAGISVDAPVFEHYTGGSDSLILNHEECMVFLSAARDAVSIIACGDKAPEIIEKIKGLIPIMEEEEKEDDQVEIKFWTNSAAGPSGRRRLITVPNLEDIKVNYNSATLETINGLSDLERPEGKGKLILFHGPPGTGKTFCIRALAKKWKGWCVTEYVVDPEQLFGDSSYLMSLILDEDDFEKRYRLLIMEDVDEFLTIDAKTRQGQSMSRLLNVSEGLIGQGVNILILMTTNEPIANLNDAVKRPGRCLAEVKFNSLEHSEVEEWCRLNGAKTVPSGQRTLAQLYSETREMLETKE